MVDVLEDVGTFLATVEKPPVGQYLGVLLEKEPGITSVQIQRLDAPEKRTGTVDELPIGTPIILEISAISRQAAIDAVEKHRLVLCSID